ncbi:heat-inducible transcription repressor HrcA [Baekduia soli]|uniref:Heat-inducible transcription repressor HrcA n=1 Tax=Baekduia soli TaxID=496014 RepID=A0A5B8U9C2_9ACTN|nr:heat-inducible transcriptional repressor HrcA [Baekduia soli]QEC49640.1 heat-inducible transcription repressor HrcA [Baekduia soli]
MLSPRQELILRKVVEAYASTGQPVGSKTLATDPDLEFGPSTIRNELASLEEYGLLAHPHTSAGRAPTDAGHRWYVDHLQSAALVPAGRALGLQLMRREVDEAMRVTSETLSQVTNLLAIVSAPPIDTATIRHVEVLLLQPQVLMVVVITSTGGVTKRVFTFDRPVDPGLVQWAGSFLSERLEGVGLGARMLHTRLSDPSLSGTELAFLVHISPVFTELAETAQDTLYVDGAARLIGEHRVQDLAQINELMQMLERRASLLGLLRDALREPDVLVRIGSENEAPALQTLAVVGAGYGLPARKLGTVSVIGPVRMDYARAIRSVREAAFELSRFIEDVYGP